MKTEILVAALVGGLAGFGAGLLVGPGEARSGREPAPRVSVDLDPLLAELRGLRRTLDLPVAGGDPSPLAPPGDGAVDVGDVTEQVLQRLLDALDDRLAVALPEPTDFAPTMRTGFGRPQDRQAVEALRASLPADPEYTPVAVFGLTPRQVYARYGTPTSTWTPGDGSVHWMYATEDETGWTTLQFFDGYVVDAWAE